MHSRLILTILVIFVAVLVLGACGSQQASPPSTTAPIAQADDHTQEEAIHDEDEEDHDSGAHSIPDEAAAVPNPIAANPTSIESGQQIYTASCAVCHGKTGLGDGTAGAALDPPPSNLYADHVQVLLDGALFYTIHNGIEGTGMPGWGASLSEDDIWHVVNFIRTFKE